jgi:hypothetical protein
MSRYEVKGYHKESKAAVKTVYHRREAAVRFAETLLDSEVYDKLEKRYIMGTNKIVQLLIKTNSDK